LCYNIHNAYSELKHLLLLGTTLCDKQPCIVTNKRQKGEEENGEEREHDIMNTDERIDLNDLDPRFALWVLRLTTSPKEASAMREARAWIHSARQTVEICGKCGRELDERETVYKIKRSTYWFAPVCDDCAPRYMKDMEERRYPVEHLRKIFPSHPCEECGRTVSVDDTPALWRRPRHVICYKRCQGRYYTAGGARHRVAGRGARREEGGG
jgi:hypothetical protein